MDRARILTGAAYKLAQMAEHQSMELTVAGSSPARSRKGEEPAKLVRARSKIKVGG